MANDQANAPNIPPADEDIPLLTNEKEPRAHNGLPQHLPPPFYNGNEPVILVAGPNHHMPNNGPRRRPVFGVPFAFMYEGEEHEMIDLQADRFHERDLIVGLEMSHPDSDLLAASEQASAEYHRRDLSRNTPQSSGTTCKDAKNEKTTDASKKDGQDEEEEDNEN